MKIKFKNKIFEVDARKSSGIRGLMFCGKETKALFFETKGAIHSLFVFFPFIILWIDNKNAVVDCKIVKPFSFHVNTNKEFERIVEIPLSRRYNNIVKIVVGERFKKNK